MSASQHGAPHESNEQSALAIEQFERGVKEFVVQKLKKPKYQSYILLWMLGLYLLFFTVGIVVSPDVQEKYDQTMNEAGSVDLREFQRGVMMLKLPQSSTFQRIHVTYSSFARVMG
eukprot:873347_1